jgi:hypothetical protein
MRNMHYNIMHYEIVDCNSFKLPVTTAISKASKKPTALKTPVQHSTKGKAKAMHMQDPGILCEMSYLYPDRNGSQNQLMSDPFVDGKHEIWPEVQSLLGP